MKTYLTTIGKKVTILEKLIEWESQAVFYKIKWDDGIMNIIHEKEFKQLIIEEGMMVSEKQLTNEDKFKLYYQYFRGRQEVYAVKWESLKGKTGFSPHAQGEWVQEKVGKQLKNKFQVHSYYPYTLETVENHIRGTLKDFRLGTGIYPMLTDDTTYLVVIDFDDEKAIETVKPKIGRASCRERV